MGSVMDYYGARAVRDNTGEMRGLTANGQRVSLPLGGEYAEGAWYWISCRGRKRQLMTQNEAAEHERELIDRRGY